MSLVDKKISSVVESLFPSFYKEEGEIFVQFVKAYYEFMEQTEGVETHLRSLNDYYDIDKTIDEFVLRFKEQYLPDIDFTTQTDRRSLIKHAKEFLSAKGSEEGIKLLFRLVYGEEASVYQPSEKILRPSDGKWFIPLYLELESTPKTRSFVGKNIVGSSSGATAFAERLATKTIGGKRFDVLYISNVKGSFQYKELVTSDGSIEGAPRVIGSMTNIDMSTVGKDFVVGDVVNVISSSSGKLGKARVTSIGTATGRVLFDIQDGGFGFTNNAIVLVSSRVLNLSVKTPYVANNWPYTDFIILEQVEQPLATLTLIASTGSIEPNTFVTGYNGANAVGTGYVVGVPSTFSGGVGTIKVLVKSGTFSTASDVKTNGNTVAAVIDTYANSTAVGTMVGTTNNAVGVANVVGTFTSNTPHAFVRGTISNTYANVTSLSTGDHASFDVGRLTNVERVFLNTDRLGANNTGNTPFLSIKLNGEGSNVGFVDSVTVVSGGSLYTNNQTVVFTGGNPTTPASGHVVTNANGTITSVVVDVIGAGYDGVPSISITGNTTGSAASLVAVMDRGYGFVKDPNGDLTTVLNNVLTRDTFNIGTISGLTNIDLGSGYNQDPFVLVIEPGIAGFNRRDIAIGHDNAISNFVVGETILQSFSTTQFVVTYTSKNAQEFEYGEIVSQGAAEGTVTEFTPSGSTTGAIRIEPITGSFSANATPIVGQTTGASATVAAVANTSVISAARGVVKSVSPGYVVVSRRSFNTSFTPDIAIVGSTSGVSANVVTVSQDESSRPIGFNADVTAAAGSANGVINSVEVIDSGFAYKHGELVQLQREGNQYVASGYVDLVNEGQGEGYFISENGFLNGTYNYVHDNDYWQDYSYEVRTGLALSRYSDVLKRVVHVAGTRMFGSVVKLLETSAEADPEGNVSIATVDTVLTLSTGNTFTNSEFVTVGGATIGFANGGVYTKTHVDGYASIMSNSYIYIPTATSPTLRLKIDRFAYDAVSNTTTVYSNTVTGNLVASNTSAQYYSNTYVVSIANTEPYAVGDIVFGIDGVLIGALQNSASNGYVVNTRSSTATYKNSSGKLSVANANALRPRYDDMFAYSGLLVEKQRTNILRYSEDFADGYWTKTRTNVVANDIVSLLGTQTVDKIVDTADNDTHMIQRGSLNVTAESTYTFSCFFRAAEYQRAALTLPSTKFGTEQTAIINLANGSITTTSGTAVTHVERFDDGWYRFGLTQTATSSGTCTVYIKLIDANNNSSFVGTGTSGLHVWGAQLEDGNYMSSYIPTTSSDVTRSADSFAMTSAGWKNAINKSGGRVVMKNNSTLVIQPMVELYHNGSNNYAIPKDSTIVQIQNNHVVAQGTVLFSNASHIITTVDIGPISKRNSSVIVANTEAITCSTNALALMIGETVNQTIDSVVVANGIVQSTNTTHVVVVSLSGGFVSSSANQSTWIVGQTSNAYVRASFSNTITFSVNTAVVATSFASNDHVIATSGGSARINGAEHNTDAHVHILTTTVKDVINKLRISEYRGGAAVGQMARGNTSGASAYITAIER